RKGLPVLLHATGWIILFILPQFLISGGLFKDQRTTQIVLFNTLVFVVLFYTNYLWLVPRLAQRKKWLAFLVMAAALIVLMGWASGKFYENLFAPPREVRERVTETEQRPPRDDHSRRRGGGMALYNFFITSFLVSGFAVGIRYAESAVRKDEEIKELEREKLNSELALLKNQVSPHFFFNTLNNIYSLIAINQEDAREAVLSLSKMMRYMLYESEQGNTRLSNEIEFIKGYIDLMKLRLSERVRLSVSLPEEYEDRDVPPLLFIPFIENAFKHGVSNLGNSFIDIGLRAEGGEITFLVANSISHQSAGTPRAASGIGLDNVRKRLALLYPGHHELRIGERETVFTVELIIRS
ncbi:hypothetical protein EG827_13065, partial [bacterium]|nr:hypothetical protein [bacterium]